MHEIAVLSSHGQSGQQRMHISCENGIAVFGQVDVHGICIQGGQCRDHLTSLLTFLPCFPGIEFDLLRHPIELLSQQNQFFGTGREKRRLGGDLLHDGSGISLNGDNIILSI